jgi:hypothetical protein
MKTEIFLQNPDVLKNKVLTLKVFRAVYHKQPFKI